MCLGLGEAEKYEEWFGKHCGRRESQVEFKRKKQQIE
jgi:hypothetical protein